MSRNKLKQYDKKMGFSSYLLSLFLYIMSSYLRRYSILYELNTLDACWIAVYVWSNSIRCRQESFFLTRTWCLYLIIIALDIVITLCFSINCSTLICSPTVLYAILRETSSETYGPRVYFLSYKFLIYYFAIFYFKIYKPKNPKIFYLLFIYLYLISILQVTVKGLTTPLSRWVQVVWLFVQVLVICALSPTGLIPCFSNWGKYLSLLCCITLSSSREKPMQAQEVAASKSKIGTSSATRWRRQSTASVLGRRRTPGSY